MGINAKYFGGREADRKVEKRGTKGLLCNEYKGRVRPMKRCEGCVWKSENGLYCVWPVCKKKYEVLFAAQNRERSARSRS